MVAPLTLHKGLTIGKGITFGAGTGSGGTAGVYNVVGYNEMPPPVVAGQQLEDSTATIDGSTGFTINNDGATGIAMLGLTLSNVNWFAASYSGGPELFNVTWGSGSTVTSSSVLVVQIPSGVGTGPLTFFIQDQTGTATYNYPFTFSI